MTTSKSKILFIMTGSIACFKACQVISKLVQLGHDLEIVASSSALRFVGEATLEGLTGKKVHSDLWEQGQAMAHIHLVRWADLILLAPASANTLNKMAQGVGDDLVTTLFLAHDFKKPFLVAPAMNTSMYLHPITQGSVRKLRELGIGILETASGVLACGESGLGRLLEPELILAEVDQHLKGRKMLQAFSQSTSISPPFRVLITSGGTQEPIDDVRVITNKSSGATGAQLADDLFDLGFDVTLLHAESAIRPRRDVQTKSYVTFLDLQTQLKELLSSNRYHAIIHSAAVSDFSLAKPAEGGKLNSDQDLTLRFQRNPKLVNELKAQSNGALLIAFKMTSTEDVQKQAQAVDKLFRESFADIVVHNDVRETHWQGKVHSFHWHRKGYSFDQQVLLEGPSSLSQKMAQEIFKMPQENV